MKTNQEKILSIASLLTEQKKPLNANDSIHELLPEGALDVMRNRLEELFAEVLTTLLIDYKADPNTVETPKRLAKMYIDEVMYGRFYAPPKVTVFPNTKGIDELYTTGPIAVRSMCSHHFVPVIGNAWVGVIPGENIVGLSKFNRLIDWVMARPQIQEDALVQIADLLEEELKPKGLIVVLKATHYCVHWRGVKDNSVMVNSVLRGLFKHNPSAKQEFFEIIKGQGYLND